MVEKRFEIAGTDKGYKLYTHLKSRKHAQLTDNSRFQTSIGSRTMYSRASADYIRHWQSFDHCFTGKSVCR